MKITHNCMGMTMDDPLLVAQNSVDLESTALGRRPGGKGGPVFRGRVGWSTAQAIPLPNYERITFTTYW